MCWWVTSLGVSAFNLFRCWVKLSLSLSFSLLPSLPFSLSTIYYWLRISFNLLKVAKLIRKVWGPLYGQYLRQMEWMRWNQKFCCKGIPWVLGFIISCYQTDLNSVIEMDPYVFSTTNTYWVPIPYQRLSCWEYNSEQNRQTLCLRRDYLVVKSTLHFC